MTDVSSFTLTAVLAVVVVGCTSGGSGAGTTETQVAAQAAAGDTRGLTGSAWRLEDLAGAGMLEDVEAALEFPEEGRVAGRASCNRFFGAVEISGETIAFASLGATRMACAEPVMSQEARYLEALQQAERFTLDGATLLIHLAGTEQPLRFARLDP